MLRPTTNLVANKTAVLNERMEGSLSYQSLRQTTHSLTYDINLPSRASSSALDLKLNNLHITCTPRLTASAEQIRGKIDFQKYKTACQALNNVIQNCKSVKLLG